MHEVEPVLEGSEYQTDVWAATERVLVAMEKLRKKKALLVDRFFKLIKKCAVAGFGNVPTNLVRHEGNGVYAIGDRHGPLLRASGFYLEGQAKQTFVIMDFYEKHGQKPREAEKERIVQVAQIRDKRQWVRVSQ
jgi:glutamate dehydrogenase/leucine dehydrogenase